jgi:hypothetical protein
VRQRGLSPCLTRGTDFLLTDVSGRQPRLEEAIEREKRQAACQAEERADEDARIEKRPPSSLLVLNAVSGRLSGMGYKRSGGAATRGTPLTLLRPLHGRKRKTITESGTMVPSDPLSTFLSRTE